MIKVILIILLVVSIITDIKKRKILNIATVPSIMFALMYYVTVDGLTGFLFSSVGFVVGLCLLLIPYVLGGIGAGDVKLMAAIGALMGTSFVFYSFIYTALIGGILALFIIINSRGSFAIITSIFNVVIIKSSLGSMVIPKERKSSISFPYGVAIVLGTFCTLIWGGF